MAQTTNWDAEYDKVKEYDSYASRLKNGDGTWKKPNTTIATLLKELSPEILAASKELDVDPRAIAGSILAENSLNVGVSDGVQDWLVKKGLASKGSMFGKKFTFGIGQLYFSTAKDAETYIAKIENRQPMTDDQINDALKDPKLSIRMVAKVLRQAQDIYQKYGFNIKNDPAILTTVYNLGKPESRAKAARNENRLPKPNYFGLFVAKNLNKVTEVSGYIAPAPKPVVVAKAATPPSPPPIKPKPAPAAPTVKLVKRKVTTASMALLQGPPSCDHSNMENNDNSFKYDSFKQYGAVGVVEKGTSWTLISPALDCDSNKWSMIRTENGLTGWVKTEELEKKTGVAYLPKSGCTSKNNQKCQAAVRATAKDLLAKEQPEKLTFIHPISPEGSKPDFKNFDRNCGQQNSMTPVGMGGFSGNMIKPLGKGLNDLTSLNNLLDRLHATIQKIGDLDDPENPYSSGLSYQMSTEAALKSCILSQRAGTRNCDVDVAKINQALDLIQVVPEPTLAQAQNVGNQINLIGSEISKIMMKMPDSAPWAATDDEVNTADYQSVNTLLNKCSDKLQSKNLKNSKDRLNEIQLELSQAGESGWSNLSLKQAAVNSVKFCSALLDFYFDDQSLDKESHHPLCKARFNDVAQTNTWAKHLSKNIARKMEKSSGFDFELSQQFAFLSNSINSSSSRGNPVANPPPSGFCPNRTAEYIENLLEKHPCIQKIYIPNYWLISRLNAVASKVVYRPFENDDVYAIEFTETQCKP